MELFLSAAFSAIGMRGFDRFLESGRNRDAIMLIGGAGGLMGVFIFNVFFGGR